jgi:hypothetical protein
MAGIDDIIAGGAGSSSRADFSNLFSGGFDAYNNARDQKAKNDLRDAFKGGMPMLPDGSGPDFPAIAKTFYQKGSFEQGNAAINLGQQQQNLQMNREGADYAATGGQGQSSIVSPPSANRGASTVVAPPLNRGGVQTTGGQQDATQSTQGAQGPTTVMKILAAHVPNDQLGAASASVMRQLADVAPGLSATDPIDINDPRISNVLRPAVAFLKRGGIGQVQPPQPGDGALPQQPPAGPPQVAQARPPQAPQAQPQQQPQAQPSPFANAVAAGLIPPGVDPVRYVAGLKYRAAALPKGPAQELMQSQVNAIDKATELTQGQRDFSASRASPGLDEYAAQKEADVASAKGVAEANVKEQNDLIADGKMASKRLTTLNTISNIISSDKSMTLGFGADTALKVKMALEQMGVNVGDLSGPQAIQKLNAALASESTKAISPRPAQFEFKTFLGNNPGLSLDKPGNERVIGIFSQLAKRDVELGRLARQNRDNWDRWDNVVQQYDKQNPIKDPTTGKVITTDSVVAPGPQQQNKLPSPEPGKTMVNGHIYKGGDPNVKSNWELRS